MLTYWYNIINLNMVEKLQLFHLFSFMFFFFFFYLLEFFFPLRKKEWSTKKRWTHNISLSVLNTLFVRVLFIITPVSIWFFAEERWIGLFNLLEINFVLEIIVSIIIFDFLIYVQHILAHKLKWFWKIHSIHHSDITLDVTTAVRFHTLEIIISLFIKIFFVFIFWFNPIIILIFEIILVSSSLFNHSNLKLYNKLDTFLSYFLVTPKYHQVHHSSINIQTNSNYGFFLSIWDRIFWTYTYHNFYVKNIWLDYVKEDLNFMDLILLNIKK